MKTSQAIATFLNTDIGEKLASRRATGGTRPALDYQALRSIPIVYNEQFYTLLEQANILSNKKEQEAKELLDSIDKYLLDELGITLPNPQTHLQNRIWTAKFSELSGARFDPSYHQNYYKQLELALKNGKYPISKLKYVGLMINGSLIPDYFYTTQKTKRAYIRIKDLSFNQEIDFGTLVYINDNFRATQETIVEEKDIVFATIGATIGKANMVPKELKGSFISNNTSKFTLLDNVKNNILFFESFFKSILFQEFIKNKTTITAQPKITNQDILNLKIPLPPLAIQEKIAEEIQKRKQKALKLTEEAKGLLEQAKKQVESMILGG